MQDNELREDELELVSTINDKQYREIVEAYFDKNFERVIELGSVILSNPAFNEGIKQEVTKMVVESKDAISNNNVKGFTL